MLNRLDRNYKLAAPLLVMAAIVVNMAVGQLVQYVFGARVNVALIKVG